MRTLAALILAMCLAPLAASARQHPKAHVSRKKPGTFDAAGAVGGKTAAGPLGAAARAWPHDLRPLPRTRDVRGGEKPFISPDEAWTAVLPSGWQVSEMEGGTILLLVPPGARAQNATRLITLFTGQLKPEEQAYPDTALLQAVSQAVVQQLTQGYGVSMTIKSPAEEAKFNNRPGASIEYTAPLPRLNTTLGLWGGMARENGYAMIVGALARGDDFAATQKEAQRILETVKQYQAPRNPELERALLGRWSGILSVKTGSTSSSSSTVTFQFNPDGGFWRRTSHSYLSTGGAGSLSGASDDFDRGTYTVLGRHIIVNVSGGGILRLRVEGQMVGGRLQKVRIGGTEVTRGEV